MKISPIGLVLLCALQPGLPAQDLEITTRDGGRISVAITGISGTGAEARLVLGAGGEGRTLPLSVILGFHGPAPRPVSGAVVHLVGGDELRGVIRAGDPEGETFRVDSPSLGEVAIQVDRLREIVLAPGIRAEDLRVPDSADQDEAIFLPTGRARLDTLVGAMHRFTAEGVVFEESGRRPREFAYADLAGIALRGGLDRGEPAPIQLITRSGDSVGGELLGFRDGRFQIRLEGNQVVQLRGSDIAALTFRGEDRRFLSDLVPEVVEESSYFGDGAEPLYPFQRDRTATGNFLVAGGRTYGKGLGVHSKSRLSFRVPAGFSKFYCLVAVDDEVKSLALRANVDVKVLRGDEELFVAPGLGSGDAVVKIGVLELQPGDLITLEVDYGKGLGLADRVDWLSAVFLK